MSIAGRPDLTQLISCKGLTTTVRESFLHFLACGDTFRDTFLRANGTTRVVRLTLAKSLGDNAAPTAVARVVDAMLGSRTAGEEHLTKAESLLSAALVKHNRPSPLLLAAARLHMAQQRADKVEAIYREILRKDARNVVALNDLAMLLAAEGRQLGEAQQLVQKAMEVAGPIAELLDTRAVVSIARGKPREALEDLQQALAQVPAPLLYLHQALAYSRLGQDQAALAALQKGEQMGLEPSWLPPLERCMHRQLVRSLQ